MNENIKDDDLNQSPSSNINFLNYFNPLKYKYNYFS